MAAYPVHIALGRRNRPRDAVELKPGHRRGKSALPAPGAGGRAGLAGHPGCDQFAKLGDLSACGNEETLVVSRSGRQIGRFQIEVEACPTDNHGTMGNARLDPLSRLDRKTASGC